MATLKIAMCGYGVRGQEIGRAIHLVPDLQFVDIADTNLARRVEARRNGLAAYETLEELLETARPDIVVVATMPQHRLDQVRMAAEHGCHMLIEKPLAFVPSEADAMVEAVAKAGVRAAVDFEVPFADSFKVFRRALENERFGKLLRFEMFDKGRAPAYDIETCVSHYLHLAMLLLGCRPTSVSATIVVDGRRATLEDVRPMSELWPHGREHGVGLRADAAQAHYLYPNGVTAHYFPALLDEDYVMRAGASAKKPGSEFMALVAYGTRGRVKLHQTQTGFVYVQHVPQDTLTEMQWRPVYIPDRPDAAWVIPTSRLIADLVDAIRTDRKPLATIEDAAHIVHQTAGIYVSHFAGRPVSLPLEERGNPLLR